jgi:2-oxo-3-hexenedioate decarboxylase
MDGHRIGIRLGPAGWLTEAMALPAGARVPRGRLTDPHAVPHIVFVMASGLSGPGVTAPTALSAVGSAYCGMEVIDGASSEFFMTGPVGLPPASLDLSLEACLLEVNGQVVDSATGAAVHGHPAEALARAANDLPIEPGWIVLTGGMTEAVPCPADAVVAAHFTHLGSVFLSS